MTGKSEGWSFSIRYFHGYQTRVVWPARPILIRFHGTSYKHFSAGDAEKSYGYEEVLREHMNRPQFCVEP